MRSSTTTIGARAAWQTEGFARLVAHYAAFGAKARNALAAEYQVSDAEPASLAHAVCVRPELLLQAVRAHVRTAQARQLLEDLILDHDAPVRLAPGDKRHARSLARCGALAPPRGAHASIPGALAAALASMAPGVRPSLPILLGPLGAPGLVSIAEAHGIAAGPPIAQLLELEALFRDPEYVAEWVESLEEPDWIGAALVGIELGGTCYWGDVFGSDGDERRPERGASIIPLMSRHERALEAAIAESLIGAGLIARVDLPDLGAPMLCVPEELWESLRALQRSWFVELLAGAWAEAAETAPEAPQAGAPSATLRADLVWIAAEVARDGLSAPLGEQEAAALGRRAARPPGEVATLIQLGVELGIVERRRSGALAPGPGLGALDEGPRAFCGAVLAAWVEGRAGSAWDLGLGAALGLDEVWRRQVLHWARLERVPVPAWIATPGVDSELTGAGNLRSLEFASPQRLLVELELAAALIRDTKLLWLDLLSELPAQRAWGADELREILTFSAALAIYDALGRVLERPQDSLYLPIQRPSFLFDAAHLDRLDAWCAELIDSALIPLGAAERTAANRIRLIPRRLRPEPLAEPSAAERRDRLAAIVAAPALVDASGPRLARVPALEVLEPREEEGGAISVPIAAPIASIMALVGARRLARYDGERLYFDSV